MASCLAAELQSYSEVCEALTTVEVALGFLAMTGGDPHMQLSGYLEEVLQMKDQTAPHVLKVSPSVCLSVCLSVRRDPSGGWGQPDATANWWGFAEGSHFAVTPGGGSGH